MFTLAACTSHNFFTASLICRLFALMSTRNTSVLCSSIFFIADSVFRGLPVKRGISIRPEKSASDHSRNNDTVLIHARRMQHTLALILRYPWQAQSLRSVERNTCSRLAGRVRMHALQRSFLCSLGLSYFLRCCSVFSFHPPRNTSGSVAYFLRPQPWASRSSLWPFFVYLRVQQTEVSNPSSKA